MAVVHPAAFVAAAMGSGIVSGVPGCGRLRLRDRSSPVAFGLRFPWREVRPVQA